MVMRCPANDDGDKEDKDDGDVDGNGNDVDR